MPRIKKKRFHPEDAERVKISNSSKIAKKKTMVDVTEGPEHEISVSERKLGSVFETLNKPNESTGDLPSQVTSPDGNRIINCSQLSKMLELVSCKSCGSSVELMENQSMRHGWCSQLIFLCTNTECERRKKPRWTPSSPKERYAEINRRLVLGMRYIGRGHRPALRLSSCLNLPSPISKPAWKLHTDALVSVSADVLEQDHHNAAIKLKLQHIQDGEIQIPGIPVETSIESLTTEQKYILDTTIIDTSVTVDGSWGHRGFCAREGMVSVISTKTGEIIDSILLTNKCQTCAMHKESTDSLEYDLFMDNHFDSCPINHEGSAAAMESEGACKLWCRSVSEFNLRYTTFIGDGDSKSYKAVVETRPYGDTEIIKKQCIGHVQKRMGSRLRSLVNTYKGKKLSDGKTLGGKGRLTLQRIDFFQNLYGQALRKNSNVNDMASQTKAILMHYSDPEDHSLCPKDTRDVSMQKSELLSALKRLGYNGTQFINKVEARIRVAKSKGKDDKKIRYILYRSFYWKLKRHRVGGEKVQYSFPPEILQWIRAILPNEISGEIRPEAYKVSLEAFCRAGGLE